MALERVTIKMTKTTQIMTLFDAGLDIYVLNGDQGIGVGAIDTDNIPKLEAIPGLSIIEREKEDD